MVSLLDLHPSFNDDSTGISHDRLEIFEAGTGHGALTLHLARAIHGANRAPPEIPPSKEPDQPATVSINDDAVVSTPKSAEDPNQSLETKATQEAYDIWRANRRAVIHTLDVSAKHSAHAQATVKNFRQGMYFPDVDFHVGGIPEYLSGRLIESADPFLEHVILDLPSPGSYLGIVGNALKPNGSLLLFCPSITQINVCVQMVKGKKLPFLLEKVLELGAGAGVGGREWDVRAVKPRALLKTEAAARESEEPTIESVDESDLSEATTSADSGVEMVCRPKVGGRISGGGFVGLWRRMEQY